MSTKTRKNNKHVTKNNKVYVGSVIETANCGKAIVLSLEGYRGDVEFFNTGNIDNFRKDHLVDGKIKDQKAPLTFGVGYTDGELVKINHKHLPYYVAWKGILERCYSTKLHNKYPSYVKATVCKEWHSLKNFKIWFDTAGYSKGFEVDKDLLVQGNKHYSPETCTLLPQRLNTLLIHKYTNRKDKTLPIGVTKNKKSKRSWARCHIGQKQPASVGYYDTVDEAFEAYKIFKENYIKTVAKEYYDKGSITSDIYDALLNYEVLKEYH